MTADSPLHALSTRLRAGESLRLGWCAMGAPALGETLVRAGFDAALFDMQHGAFDTPGAVLGITAVALAGKPALVRIPVGDFATASKLLDAGAAGIVAPMINSAGDARELVSFTKFPPLGSRSWGPNRAMTLSGLTPASYLAEAGSIQLTIAMIETREALDALDDILDVDGIDGVLVGPSDLSIALSRGAFVDAVSDAVMSALVIVADACRRRGKVAAAFCANGERAAAIGALGFQLCAAGTDELMLRAGAMAELATATQPLRSPDQQGGAHGH